MTWLPIADAPRTGLCIVNDASGEYGWRTAEFTSPEDLRAGYNAAWRDEGFLIEPQPTLFFRIESPTSTDRDRLLALLKDFKIAGFFHERDLEPAFVDWRQGISSTAVYVKFHFDDEGRFIRDLFP